MDTGPDRDRVSPAWWTLILVVALAAMVGLTSALFSGSFRTYVPVLLKSDRSGLVMESGGKVKFRGVPVGRVAAVSGGTESVMLRLEIDPDQVRYIPANIEAQIRATTAFGAKYVDLVYPEQPVSDRIVSGAVLTSRNVSTEVNTVFQNLVRVLDQVEPVKLNAVLSAVADGVRGRGERIGEATSAANRVLTRLNERSDTLRENWRALKGFGEAYGSAAQDIISILESASTTGDTITTHADSLDALLLNVIGFARSGHNLLAPNQQNFVDTVNSLEPTTDLLMKYNPSYTCLFVGAKWLYDQLEGPVGGNGRTATVSGAILLGDDAYRYPDHLPVVAAKGGPGGKPGCGSLPDASKMFPVRQLVTNTGWGRGVDIRPNPGIGHPFYANYFPVTRAVPEPPSIRGSGPPAIGPVPYPGAPAYGAPLYGPGGEPLWPGLPAAPPPAPPPPAIP